MIFIRLASNTEWNRYVFRQVGRIGRSLSSRFRHKHTNSQWRERVNIGSSGKCLRMHKIISSLAHKWVKLVSRERKYELCWVVTSRFDIIPFYVQKNRELKVPRDREKKRLIHSACIETMNIVRFEWACVPWHITFAFAMDSCVAVACFCLLKQ